MSSIRWPSPTSWAAAPKAPRSTASSTAARSTRWGAFAPASCNSSRSASAAQATWGPPRLLATMPAPAPTSGAATAAVSTMGCGSAARPVSSNTSTRACSSSPSPPPGSGTQAASTPMSASRSHTPRSSAPAAASHAARTASGGHSLSSRSRTASQKASWSSSNPKNTPGLRLPPREAEHPLGGDVALDLVGAGVDRSRQRELPALRPGSLDLGAGPEQVEGDLVQLDVQLRPPELVDRAVGAHARAARQPGHRVEREQPVGLGPHPGLDEPLTQPRDGVAPVQLDQPSRRGQEPAGGAQRQPPLRPRGGHRHGPALADLAQDHAPR